MVKVSVIMPAFNAEKYISKAIESILKQTYTNFEFIIINDGSTDKTAEIVKSYDDDRIIFLENKENKGIVYTLNKGLEISKGTYIVRMDADDISFENRIEKQVEFMEKNLDTGVLGSSIKMFGDDMESTIVNYATDSKLLKANLIFHSCIAHPSVIIRKSVLDENKLKYDSDYHGREDFKLWWDISEVSKINALSDVLLYYRVHSNQITKQLTLNSRENSRALLKKRLLDMKVDLDEEQENVLFKYCVGDISNLSYEEIIRLVYVNSKIISKNEWTKKFDNACLKKVCSLSVNYVIRQNQLSCLQKLKVLNLSRNLKIHTINMFIKSLRIIL